jgi:hypothetical protein
MPVSHDDASEALREIDRTQSRSSRLYGYSNAAPHLIVWGIAWMIGYGASYLQPSWHFVWPILIVVGEAASFWFGMRAGHKNGASDYSWRYAATFFSILIFSGAVTFVVHPTSDAQVGAFIPLIIALFYCLVGIWSRAWRMLITGVVLAVLTLIGFVVLREYFALWMAVVGGGGLILGGFWLRSV